MFKHLSFIALCLSLSVIHSTDGATTRFKGYNFESTVITDNGGRFPEITKNGSPWLQVDENSSYSIVINNPLPVRVAVAVSIDGLNSIDGKRTTPVEGRKWIIEANSSLTLRGWQTDNNSLRRFIFTNQNESYADWKEKRDKKNYSRNLGVIGVAYFWNKAELDAALHPPVPFAAASAEGCVSEKSASAPRSCARDDSPSPKRSKAGTGMGNKEENSVYSVDFNYDTGMYKTGQVLAIYYEFAANQPAPQPFIGDNRDDDGMNFTPEMP
jgi:hypothetical protein